MRYARHIFVLLLVLSYRGLSAQEFDLYDFRYYKRFESAEELLAPEKDSVEVAKFTLNRTFSTRSLDYNLSSVRFIRRGIEGFQRTTTLNGVALPYISHSTARTLQLRTEQHYGISDNGLTGELELHIDSIYKQQSNIGLRFLSRNMPYSIYASTAHRFGKGWSLSATMSARAGNDLFVKGLFGYGVSVNALATKEFNSRNRLSFALFIEPSMRSVRLPSTEEAFRLTGNNLYNPAWGYQDGKVRNPRIRREFLPTAFIGYESVLNEQTKMNISAAITAGIERYSSLDWFDAQTPAVDNYRYMPSFFADEEDIFSAVESAWFANDTRYTQIDFERLVATNKLHNGRAIYAISDRAERIVESSFRGAFDTKLERGSISYGLEITTSNTRNFKQMRDMLGAEYIIDLDYFLIDDDTYGNALQNNLDEPNRHIVKGNRFGYDYTIRNHNINAFAAYRYSTERLHLDIASKVGYTDISRKGHFRKELFSESSLGVSRHAKFAPYQLHIAGEYLVGNNHLLGAKFMANAQTCEAEDLFLQSQYNNRLIDNPTMRKGYAAELRYMFQRPNLSLSATLFTTATLDEIRVEHIYDDLSREYSDFVVSNIDIVRYGLEIEGEYSFADHFRTSVALCAGRYSYLDNARVSAYSDSSNILLIDNIESHTRNLTLGNAPQIALTAGLSYYNKGWNARINANYAGLRYVEPSAIMRTNRALTMAASPEQRNEMMAQERLRDAFTLDISLSKSLYLDKLDKRIYHSKVAPRFTDKHPASKLVFRVGVRNLLGSSNMVYSARESSRLQRYKLANEYIYSRQATRYLYAYPRTYEASISFRF